MVGLPTDAALIEAKARSETWSMTAGSYPAFMDNVLGRVDGVPMRHSSGEDLYASGGWWSCSNECFDDPEAEYTVTVEFEPPTTVVLLERRVAELERILAELRTTK